MAGASTIHQGSTMKVKCQSCQSGFTVSSGKVPDAGIWLTCPKCKKKMFVKPEADEVGLAIKSAGSAIKGASLAVAEKAKVTAKDMAQAREAREAQRQAALMTYQCPVCYHNWQQNQLQPLVMIKCQKCFSHLRIDQNGMPIRPVKQYHVTTIQETALSAIFGRAALPTHDMQNLMNRLAADGWILKSVVIETRRILFFWHRQTAIITFER